MHPKDFEKVAGCTDAVLILLPSPPLRHVRQRFSFGLAGITKCRWFSSSAWRPAAWCRAFPRTGLRVAEKFRAKFVLFSGQCDGRRTSGLCNGQGAHSRRGRPPPPLPRALSRLRDPLSERFRHFVTSITARIASGWSESRGGSCIHWKPPPCHGARPDLRGHSQHATETVNAPRGHSDIPSP